MLRKKLLIVFGSLIGLLVVMAVWAVAALQGVLRDLDNISAQASAIVEQTSGLNAAVTDIEAELYRLQSAKARHLDTLIHQVQTAQGLTEKIGEHDVVRQGDLAPVYKKLQVDLEAFTASVTLLGTAQDAALVLRYNVQALEQAVALHGGVARIDRGARDRVRGEQEDLAARFRWLVLGMTVGCLVLVNTAILSLLWAAGRVLKPVDQLVEATRQLRQEHFDHRTHLDGGDEFSELAEAYNSLAERVQRHEKQRMEVISQMGLTLNHDLNNALAVVELQLQMLGQRSGGDDKVKLCLRQIRENLNRMTATLESLKHIKRIVLTDYIAGVKMLDLHRSTQIEPPASSPAPEEADTP
ncbi:MAG: HAMP domain-containing protein [Planctomycetota bacterium]|nr:HAMP domain-containing protein [Planctomycetota bacterium]